MRRSRLLAALPHGFTEASDGDFRLGLGRQQVAGVGVPARVRQVHGDRVVRGVEVHPGTEADAILSRAGEGPVAVAVADCVPILLAGPGVVAAVHAGWRGTAAAIVVRAVEAMCAAAGCRPGALRAAIGPAIGACCYEVGDEVREALAPVARGSRWRLGPAVDLVELNRGLLDRESVPVEIVAGCTRCGGRSFSHRREGATAGRMLAAIGHAGATA